MSPQEWLDLIESRAPGLRQAGVVSISLEGISVTFRHWDIQPTSATSLSEQSRAAPTFDATDPLSDPATFGGGQVPGYALDGIDREDV
jgi:hypothetical protein